jgi:16S rRNA (uracil1498-N3)-methyltransferase
MALPFFYKADVDTTATNITLDEDTSKHIVQVLRMKVGEQLRLTNGKGMLLTAEITDDNRKRCAVKTVALAQVPHAERRITIAISLTKNTSRFEWFLEKATEVGVTDIIPLLCERTEKQHFRQERMTGVLVSAMLQSQQSWLPLLHAPAKFSQLITAPTGQQKLIAHCEADNKQSLLAAVQPSAGQLILIGPEGDFSPSEIAAALQHECIPVSLGNTRLRTETAGMVAAVLLANAQ